MTSNEVRQKYLNFMEKKGHAIVPSASLVPENDPSALFISAGVQPLVPYVLGEPHPQGKLIANIQKCVRTQDIEEVGDATHDTFFEMLGYWSFGEYFKEQSIKQLYEFFTEDLGLDKNRIYITCFEGDENAPKDEESAEIWKSLGIDESRIYFQGAESNWWSVGDNGPCGPDTEVFYDVTGELGDMTQEAFTLADDTQKVVELANSVFMQYEKKDGKIVGELPNKNVDMGSGFERVVMAVQEKENIFDTDLFVPIMEQIPGDDLRARRVVADHIRTATLMIADGVLPANTDQGYILRRLLRRAVRYSDILEMPQNSIQNLVDGVAQIYEETYSNISVQKDQIKKVINEEEEKFRKTLSQALKEFEKISTTDISGKDAFILFSTYGLPIEETLELAEQKDIKVDLDGYRAEFEKHQELSRTSSAGKFKGGLAGSGEMETKYHTATHLLQAALKKVLGEEVSQKGSNITADRLRFDFTYPEKLTEEQKNEVEDLVNENISKGLDISMEEMTLDEAKEQGAVGVFDDKYGDKVKVYSIGDFSKEICGGPHVENTKDLGVFRIKKEEASSAGVRRIKAVLE